jgi:deoxyribonuclease IV
LYKIGLKLYSTDCNIIRDAQRYQKDLFDFVELYIVPGSYDKTIDEWKNFSVPYVIHMPHSFHGVNLAQAEKQETNLLCFKEAQRFSNELESDIIIVHGGNSGNFSETIRQIALFKDVRIERTYMCWVVSRRVSLCH